MTTIRHHFNPERQNRHFLKIVPCAWRNRQPGRCFVPGSIARERANCDPEQWNSSLRAGPDIPILPVAGICAAIVQFSESP
jgi:hypothetical protein